MHDQASNPNTTDDFSDLGFDVERHREAFRSFTALALHPESIRPALIARNLVFYEVTQGKFSIEAATDSEAKEKIEHAQEAAVVKALYQSGDSESVERVRSDVERYFRRHFPGRSLEGKIREERVTTVFIVVYPPENPSL